MTIDEKQARTTSFDVLYQASPDPWDFKSSSYERARYAATLSFLARETYHAAFEPGCSIGELTALLASRCSRLISSDISPTATERARRRCHQFPNVTIECSDLATSIPQEPLDLIMFSEIGYYFPEHELTNIARSLANTLRPAGQFLAVHWLGTSTDHVLHGDQVHEILHASLPLSWSAGERHEGFRIDSWTLA